jgi:hypothetical protein
LKILHLDIETAPNLAHVWGLWQQNVALNQLMASGYILCWAAKWDGQPEVFFDSVHQSSQKKMLRGIHRLLNEADAVVTYNGVSFDMPTLNGEFIQQNMAPPAPYENIDLLLAVRKRFRLPSYKLEYVARHLGVGSKVKHEGHPLWVRCMNGDEAAWCKMERYNKGDVRLQERVYHRILGWIPNHPNRALYVDDANPMCRNCGSKALIRQGERRTREQRYARYQCGDCGAWCRGNNKLAQPTKRRAA